MQRIEQWEKESKTIAKILKGAPNIDKFLEVSPQEFARRQKAVMNELKKAGFKIGIVFSDEHFHGDVPYLGGNINVILEQVAGIIGENGFHIVAGQEGCYISEQLSKRSEAQVHRVEMMKIPGTEYPTDAERIEDIIEEAAGCKPDTIALLTSTTVIPVGLYDFLSNYLGGSENIIGAQELFNKVKYEKSDEEMKLIEDASKIADVMVKGMLSILKPGMLETQVAGWGYNIALELGAEQMGVDISVMAGEDNRSIIGRALNRRIKEGDFVTIGVAPTRDGLTACERVSVVAVEDPTHISPGQKYWLDFIGGAFNTSFDAFKTAAKNNLPASTIEQAVIDYFSSKQDEVSNMIGKPIDLAKQKAYACGHNTGYTECLEFYGPLSLANDQPLGNQIANMLDISIKGTGDSWDDVIIPGLDFLVVEKTLGKYGSKVKILNDLPVNMQGFVGKGVV